jgi:Copper transport outer membrane protein, MctB
VIDFRYHLVSIVSIFMALAVGIVLGAGPLKGDIGASLTQQVTQLRADKAQLRSDLDVAKRDTAAHDTFDSVVSPAIMKSQLTGRTVALLVAPGTDADLVKNTTTSLVAAGAKVGSTVTLTDAWADPTKTTIRDDLVNRFAALLKVPTGASSPDQLAATVLMSAILAGPDHSIPALTSPAVTTLQALQAGGLIDMSADQVLGSSSVVFLGGPVKGSTPQDASARLAAYVQLVGSLDTGASAVVVATKSNSTDPTLSEDLVAGVRRDSNAVKIASTVDDADLPLGQGTLVLALAEQYTGSVGQYGLAADAKAIVPNITVKK